MKHVVQFSGGVGSWATSRYVKDNLVDGGRGDELILLFADTLIEDEQTYAFLEAASVDIGVEITRICMGETPWDVFKRKRFLGNSRIDPCSENLKRKPLRAWIEENCTPEDTVIYIGIDWSEAHRLDRAKPRWLPWDVQAPLVEALWSKEYMHELAREHGLPKQRLYEFGLAHANCFTLNTQFITSEGLRTFEEAMGKTVKVLGRGGRWKDATIESFGVQPTMELVLTRNNHRYSIVTTAGHQWPVRKFSDRKQWRLLPTNQLKHGHLIETMYSTLKWNMRPSSVGVAAGFTFGDGSASTATTQIHSARAHFCGPKDALLPYFPANSVINQAAYGCYIPDLPRSWKQLPNLDESKSYLYGWLAGLFAADGTVTKVVKLSTARLDVAEAVQDIAIILGIGANPTRMEMRFGYGKERTALYSVSFVTSTLREDFFVLPKHRERFLALPRKNRPDAYVVESITATGREEDVACAVVPDGHMFTLHGNLHTSNCGGGCVKAGQGHWAQLYEKFPERFMEWEKNEADVIEFLDKPVSMMTEMRKGVKRPLPLSVLRKRLDCKNAGEKLEDGTEAEIDMYDIGGCGCALE
jgi:LAGLIDADG-like domain